MKKFVVHLIYLLLIGFLLIYAHIKTREAEKASSLAAENTLEAQKQKERAEATAAEAIRLEAEIVHTQMEAERLFAECQNKK